VAAGVVYLLLGLGGWFQPRVAFVPFWVGRYGDPHIAPSPELDADREALTQARLFAEVESGGFENPNRGEMLAGLDALRLRKANESVVVSISARAVVDPDGKIEILAEDSHPDDPRTQIRLAEVIRRVRDCPSRRKLLILDIMKGPLDTSDLGGMGTADAVSDLIQTELKADDLGSMLVLTACSPAENDVNAEWLVGSLFHHHLRLGLQDPGADANRNGRISARELAAYLAQIVDRDARHFRGRRQRPALFGSGDDFALAAVGAERPESAGAVVGARSKAEPGGDESAPKKEAGPTAVSKASVKSPQPDEKEPKGSKDGSSRVAGDMEKATELGEGQKAYPEWLAAGWSIDSEWLQTGSYRDAPRTFRVLGARLIRAEERWRQGDSAESIRAETESVIRELRAEWERARSIEAPSPRSVGQVWVTGWRPDPALVNSLRASLRRRREPEPFASPEQVAATLQAAVKAFADGLKGKTSLDLAGAVVAATAEERFDAPTLAFLDSVIVDALKVEPAMRLDKVELRFLRQLAARSALDRSQDWSADVAKQAWDVVCQAERANNRAFAFAWVRGRLDEADALRHDAEVMLRPELAGYLSWSQIGAAWQKTASAYDFIETCQNRLGEARNALDHARAVLPAAIPYLERLPSLESTRMWKEASDAAVSLDAMLVPPGDGHRNPAAAPLAAASSRRSSPAAAPSREMLEALNNDLAAAVRKLDGPLHGVLRPFSVESLARLIRLAVGGGPDTDRPDPDLAWTIEAILATPLPDAKTRSELWRAGRILDDRLARLLGTGAGETGRGEVDLAARKDELSLWRAGRLAALFNLDGRRDTGQRLENLLNLAVEMSDRDRERGLDQAHDPESVRKTWGTVATVCLDLRSALRADLESSSADRSADIQEDRVGWVAPVFDLVQGDRWRNEVTHELRLQDARALWSWLGARYRHEHNDRRDPDRFDALAADDFSRGSVSGDVYPIFSTESSPLVELSGGRSSARVPIQIRLQGPPETASQPMRLRVLASDDPRFRASLVDATERELIPDVPQTATLEVSWTEGPGRASAIAAAPTGVILQADLGRFVYNLPIPLHIVPESERLRVVLSEEPARLAPVSADLRLRPSLGRRSYFLFVRNPSTAARSVLVEIWEGDHKVPGGDAKLTIAPGATEAIKAFGLGETTPKSGNTTPPPQPATPPAQDGSNPSPGDEPRPLPELTGSLRIRLKDEATGRLDLDQELLVELASPKDLLEVTSSQFTPAGSSEPNRLEVRLRARPALAGAGCPVLLHLDRDRIPALTGDPKIFQLSGTLEPGGELTLFAEGLPLDPAADPRGEFVLDVDGVARALTFRTQFEFQGKPQRAIPVDTPRIWFEARPIVRSDRPATLEVRFEVDNPPDGALLDWRLLRSESGVLKDDRSWSGPAKARHIGFAIEAATGALQLEASLGDWTRTFDTANMRGERRLRGRLRAADGRRDVAEPYEIRLSLDDRAPQDVALGPLPREITRETRLLPVSAAATPPPAGFKQVDFFFGKPTEFEKAQAEGKLFKGRPVTDDPKQWTADLPLPTGASGSIQVSVRFLNQVGLAGFDSREIAILEPRPAPAPEAGSQTAPPKPGAIEGKVTEGNRAQPGLTVFLYDLSKTKPGDDPVAGRATTAKDGSYSFKDLNPGSYRLYCTNPASVTRAVVDATVKPGETAAVNLPLFR
jgi:hypothetical protein